MSMADEKIMLNGLLVKLKKEETRTLLLIADRVKSAKRSLLMFDMTPVESVDIAGASRDLAAAETLKTELAEIRSRIQKIRTELE